VVVCGVPLLALPACRIPNLRPAEPAASLPAGFPVASATTGTGGGFHSGNAIPLAAAVGGLGVVGCAANPPGAAGSSESSARLGIDEFFGDPTLSRLIAEGLAGNQELKIRAEDIQIARNEILARIGAYLPFLTLGTSAGVNKSSVFTTQGAAERQLFNGRGGNFPDPLPNYLVAGNFSWQVDIWRKLRNARDAASLRYLATTEGRNYVVTRLVADVAENYYTLLALDQRLETLDRTIALQEQSRLASQLKLDNGRGSSLAVQRFQAEVRRNQSEKLIVRQEVIEAENRINFLLGRFPQPVERTVTSFLDLNLHSLDVGVPAQLLLNRPDIRQAEDELQAAGLEVKVARADFFPSLDITGSIGYEAFNPRFLFNPEAFVANAGGNLVAPLVNRAAIKAVYGSANARQLQSVYNYQRVVLNAFTEVVNRVSMAENYGKSIALKRQQLESLEASVDAATKLYQNARAEYIEVLFAQRDLLEARTTLIETKRRQLSAVVNTYQALGGGDLSASSNQNPPQPLAR
jgi:NodT family efflux transporter outer membrane factor (OMF) lipoprotein